jgi:hypothetical protein
MWACAAFRTASTGGYSLDEWYLKIFQNVAIGASVC